MKIQRRHVIGLTTLSLLLPATADVIYSNLQNIAIPNTYAGVYLDVNGSNGWNTDMFNPVTGWDINLFFSGLDVANTPGFQPVRSGTTSMSAILNLAAGTSVGSGSVFSTFVQGVGGETPGTAGYGGSIAQMGNAAGQFAVGTEGYLGFQLNGTGYGWMRVVLGGATPVIEDWAYDTSGTPIVVGRVQQSAAVAGAQTVTLSPGTGESFTLGSLISNSGGNVNSVFKTGDGTTTLSGTNTYTGVTTISTGTLKLNATNNIANSTRIIVGDTSAHNAAVLDLTNTAAAGTWNLVSGQTLTGYGTVNLGSGKTLNVNSGAHWAPGGSIGTNAVTGNLTLAGAADFELGTTGASHASPGTSDLTNVTGTLTLGGTLNLIDNANANGQGIAGAGSYRIFTQSGTAGSSFATINNIAGFHAKVDTSVSGSVFLDNYQIASANTLTNVAFGNYRNGSSPTANRTLTNGASSTFGEGLSVSAGNTGDATVSGVPGSLIAGGGNAILTIGATAGAGVKTGTVVLTQASSGTGTSGYSTTALSGQTINVTGTAYDKASPTLNTAGPVDFGIVHAGATNPTGNVSITNTTISNASYQDSLDAGATSDNVKVTGNTFTAQTAGTTGSLTLTANASSAGSLVSTVTLSYVSNANGVSGLSNEVLSSGSIATTGQVYSGQSVWSAAGSGNWGTLASGFGANWGTNQGSPGLDSGFTGVDTATFGGAGGTVSLNGAAPSLNAVSLGGSGSYDLTKGSGGSLTMAGTTPIITATGTQVISAPVTLASGTTVAVTNLGDRLDVTGAIGGTSLTKTGAGTLTLSGTNDYSGTTTVSNGTLLVNGSNTGSGTVSVAAPATLGGTGAIAGAVNVSGTLSPGGSSIGSLTSGALAFNNGSVFDYQLDATSVAADFQKVLGTLSLAKATGETVYLTLNGLSGGGVDKFAPETKLTLIYYTDAWNGGFFTYGTNKLAEGATLNDGMNSWVINYGSETGGVNFATTFSPSDRFVTLTLSSIPEPGSLLALGCLIGSGSFLRSRRRNR